MNKVAICKNIMDAFASSTGLHNAGINVSRYLWTDAFAVCNYLELYRQTTDDHYLHLALKLIDQVHQVLGKYRADDSRVGWISNLSEEEGSEHPAIGGLRIGKNLKERQKDEPFNERLEWKRDGQYFHYLTKWMRALNLTTHYTDDPIYSRWALELARTAHSRFTYTVPGDQPLRMYWKMSTDLSYPLVPSMGQHDPLDALISYLQLQAALETRDDLPSELNLAQEISAMRSVCARQRWATADSLGIGGLLTDACTLLQLLIHKEVGEWKLLSDLLEDATHGLAALVQSNTLDQPAHYRLAFRELGLSIGLHAVEWMQDLMDQHAGLVADQPNLATQINLLSRFLPLIEPLEAYWLRPASQQEKTWLEHENINSVMLATSLASQAYLVLN